MKKVYSLLVLTMLVLTAAAQYTSLNDKELGKLKDLIRTDADVKNFYSSFERNATQALDSTPHPIDTIGTEGKLQGDPKKVATIFALRDMRKIYSLALAYRVQGDKKYLQKATAYLLAWAAIN